MPFNPYDKLLEEQGISYSELSDAEKEVYRSASSGTRAITVSDLQEHFAEILQMLTIELCDTPDSPEFQDKNSKLKARVKNYVIMQAFLETPQKVARALEKELEEMKESKY